MANHLMQIEFTSLIRTQITTMEDCDGNEVQGIFIPFYENNIKYTKGSRVYGQFYLMQKKNDMYFGQTHCVKPRWDKEHTKRMIELGYQYTPYVGYVKPCWDKEVNKYTKASLRNEKKGVVKMVNMDDDE